MTTVAFLATRGVMMIDDDGGDADDDDDLDDDDCDDRDICDAPTMTNVPPHPSSARGAVADAVVRRRRVVVVSLSLSLSRHRC
jgi:hypothetical protein